MPQHVEETIWPCSWERVYRMQVDFPLRHPEHYVAAHPDVSEVVVLSDETQGSIRYYLMEFHAAAEIPPIFRPIVKPEMLNWTQEAWWDETNLSCRQKIIPNFMTDHLEISSNWKLEPQTDTATKEIWTVTVNCTIPALGGLLANYTLGRILTTHKKQMERNIQNLLESGG